MLIMKCRNSFRDNQNFLIKMLSESIILVTNRFILAVDFLLAYLMVELLIENIQNQLWLVPIRSNYSKHLLLMNCLQGIG